MANGTPLGFESKLWAAADALRNNMDAAEYKHVVLGLIFLKYISDAFEAKHSELETQKAQGADPEDPDEYRAASIFWVPKEGRWSYLRRRSRVRTLAARTQFGRIARLGNHSRGCSRCLGTNLTLSEWAVDPFAIMHARATAPYPRAAQEHGHPRSSRPEFAPRPRAGRAPGRAPTRS